MPLPIKLQDLLKRGVSTQTSAVPSATAPLRAWWPAWLLLAYGVLVIARAPVILFEGRFWAEEGKVFFQHACRSGWLSALVSVDSTHGYFSLLNNLAALLASRVVSLEHAPVLTAWLAFTVQLVPAVVLAFGMVPELRPLPLRVLAMLALLFVPPNSEVWLTTISGQFYLGIATMLILASDAQEGWPRHFKRIVLGFAALTGPITLFLLPLYWLRAWQERARERILQAAVLTAFALVQIVVVFAFLGESPRHVAFPIDLFAKVVVAKTALLLLGSQWTLALSVPLFRQAALGQGALWSVALAVLIVALLALFFVKSRSRNAAYLVGAAGLLLTLGFATAAEQGHRELLARHILPMGGERYYFAPNVLLFLGLLVAVGQGSRWGKLGRGILGAFLLVSLVLGGMAYTRSAALQPWNFTGPRWSVELAKGRVNPQYQPRLWPADWRLPPPPIGSCGP